MNVWIVSATVTLWLTLDEPRCPSKYRPFLRRTPQIILAGMYKRLQLSRASFWNVWKAEETSSLAKSALFCCLAISLSTCLSTRSLCAAFLSAISSSVSTFTRPGLSRGRVSDERIFSLLALAVAVTGTCCGPSREADQLRFESSCSGARAQLDKRNLATPRAGRQRAHHGRKMQSGWLFRVYDAASYLWRRDLVKPLLDLDGGRTVGPSRATPTCHCRPSALAWLRVASYLLDQHGFNVSIISFLFPLRNSYAFRFSTPILFHILVLRGRNSGCKNPGCRNPW